MITKMNKTYCRHIILLGTVMVALLLPGTMQAQVATIGTGTLTTTIYNPVSVGGLALLPGQTAPKTTHLQVLYSAAEITAAGITGPGLIDSIAWEVSQVPAQSIKNYTIKAKLNHADSIATAYESASLVTVFNQAAYTPVAGWSWMHFQTPFYWNGIDNIVFDICSDTFTTAATGRVKLTSMPTTTPLCWRLATSTQPLCGDYTDGSSSRLKPNIKMAFRAPLACGGVPASITISVAGPTNGCVGNIRPLLLNVVPNTAVTIQWQQSVNGGGWANVPANGNSIGYDATVMSGVNYVDYRAIMTCAATSQSVTSNTVTITTAASPVYAALPYAQDFESWINRCNTTDVPDSSWINEWPMGKFSWRREDQGLSAGWTADVAPLYYFPYGSTGSHSARVQSSKGPGNGSLMMLVDCSGPGSKELRFDYINKTSANNSLQIFYSDDGGVTFDSLTSLGSMGVNAQWQSFVMQIPSTTPTTVVKFKCVSIGSQSGDFDMGIDNVHMYPSCQGAPIAGTVDSNAACPGSGLTLSLSGTSAASGLTWQWQESTNGISWVDVPGGNIEAPTTPLNGPTWYRCIVTCTHSSMSDTSAPRLITPNSFYYCYCNSASTAVNPGVNIGNVKLLTYPSAALLLDNGNPLPATANPLANQHYTNYTAVPAADLYRDSTYKLNLSFFTSNGTNFNPQMSKAYTKVWIDFDRSGTFEATEMVMSHLKAASVFADSATFTIPATAQAGLTGLRIVSSNVSDSTQVQPCGAYSQGETEDYLVHLWHQPCTGAPAVGDVAVSDTLLCPGYPLTLTLSNYDTTSGQLVHIWQSSPDGTIWTDIAGSAGQPVYHTLFPSVNTSYRVKAACGVTGTEAYSLPVAVNKNVLCYCVSYAGGGFSGLADSSDVGGFTFYNLSFPLTGGHLNNPDAVKQFTNRTYLAPAMLYRDSTYNFSIDHILLRNEHADARLTLFIDYNANGVYDIPDERVYDQMSTTASWQQSGTITVPANAVVNTLTGMRLIVNNDTASSSGPGDACGIYVSGETEDYALKFLEVIDTTTGIAHTEGAVAALHVYPNPATGNISVRYYGKTLKEGMLVLQNVTGQVLTRKRFYKLADGSILTADVSGFAPGIYFVVITAEEGKGTAKVIVR